MDSRGKFIVIEGPDGTGKKTQTDLLISRFQANGIPHEMFDFPQYESTFFGKLVGRFLKGEFGGLKDVSPYLASLTYAGDRWQAGPSIRETLARGVNVIANRYFLSNVAHQAAKLPKDKREEFIAFLRELEYTVYGIPQEDLNIVLFIPAEISAHLIEQKQKRSYLGDVKKDIHEDDVGYQLEVASIYRDIPGTFRNIVGIDCTKRDGSLMTPEDIHEIVWREVTSRLNLTLPEGNVGMKERRG